MAIYWPFLHHLILEKLNSNTDDSNRYGTDPVFYYYYIHVIHSVPFIAMLINVYLSQVTFIPAHGLYLMLGGIAYGPVNYAGTLYRGHWLYPFLTWNDYRTLVIFAVCLVVFFILF